MQLLADAGHGAPLNRCRIVITGQGRTGKTSLVNVITGRCENKADQPSTQGVETNECTLKTENLEQSLQNDTWELQKEKEHLLGAALARYKGAPPKATTTQASICICGIQRQGI